MDSHKQYMMRMDPHDRSKYLNHTYPALKERAREAVKELLSIKNKFKEDSIFYLDDKKDASHNLNLFEDWEDLEDK